MTQQTATEWLCMQLLDLDNHKIWPSLLERAKNMEKEQIRQSNKEYWSESLVMIKENLKEYILIPKSSIDENNK